FLYYSPEGDKTFEKANNILRKYNLLKVNKNANTISVHSTNISNQQYPTKAKQTNIDGFHENWFITIDGKKYYYTYNNGIAQYYYQNINKVTLDIVSEYKKKYNQFEAPKKTPPHYVFKTETEKEEIDHLFSDLGGMYFRMTSANKQLVSRPEAPILPYVKLIRNGKVEYKKRSDLTEEDKKLLPPPPPPPVPASLQNPSKELLKAKKEFDEKANAYGKAIQGFNEGKGDIDDLNKQSEEVIKLYKDYMKLFTKENASTSPPPPPPAKK